MAAAGQERKSGGWWMTVQGAEVDSGSWPPVSPKIQDRGEHRSPQLWSVLHLARSCLLSPCPAVGRGVLGWADALCRSWSPRTVFGPSWSLPSGK